VSLRNIGERHEVGRRCIFANGIRVDEPFFDGEYPVVHDEDDSALAEEPFIEYFDVSPDGTRVIGGG
jgi:hypothetical protein